MKNEPRLAIALGTYNGENYLRLQMDSFIRQSYKNWVLYVSDDGSKDKTRDIIKEYQRAHGVDKIILFDGPCQGCTANYASLMTRADIEEDYMMFADQDDIWLDDKVERAMNYLTHIDETRPALYMAASIHIDKDGKIIGASEPRNRPPSLQNALVQNIAGGNTYGLNKAARALMRTIGKVDVLYPDWWIYLAVLAAGGAVHYDAKPCMLYRQHATNMIGANRGIRAKLWRIRELFFGNYGDLIWQNISELNARPHLWTAESKEVFKKFEGLRAPSRLTRVTTWRSLKLYRQTGAQDIAMLLQFLIK